MNPIMQMKESKRFAAKQLQKNLSNKQMAANEATQHKILKTNLLPAPTDNT